MYLRKKIEHNIRYFRSYVLPSHRASAKRAKQLAQPVDASKPLCVFDFQSIRIDNVTGRYLYHLVTEFESCGYGVAYTDRYRFLATMEVKACKKLLLGHTFSIVPKQCFEAKVIVTDCPEKHQGSDALVIAVEYEQVRPQANDTNAFCLPFFVHPDIHESGQAEEFIEKHDLSNTRDLSILFAGNAKSPKYDAPVLAEKYKVLSRAKALQIAEDHLDNKSQRPLELDAIIPPAEHRQSLSIATTQDLLIPSERWIQTISLADFYFACPGVEMPLCHNLIESLAAGSIPILQYPQYLTPALEDGVNCLVFHDEASLKAKLDQALSMSVAAVAQLKSAAHYYYKCYQQPGSFAQQIIDSGAEAPAIYLNAYRVPR